MQLVSIRVAAIGALAPLVIRDPPARCEAASATKSRRQVWFRETGTVDAAIHDRKRMAIGVDVPGPTVIESIESTILVPPGWQARMDDDGFVLLTRAEG